MPLQRSEVFFDALTISITPYSMNTAFSPSANLIQGTLRLQNCNPAIGSLRIARSSDSKTIQELCRGISKGERQTDDIVFTTGYGIHRSHTFPVRAPALMIPVLHVLEEMKRIGLHPPQYLVYQATDFIAETNQFDPEKTKTSSLLLEQYLRKYVEKYHKSIAEHVSFAFGCEYTDTIRASIQQIATNIGQRLSGAVEGDPSMAVLQSYEKKHSNESGAADIYAAANVFYSGADAEYPFHSIVPKNTRLILPVGGHAERPFFALTSGVADKNETDRAVIPFLTSLGARPTYYPAPDAGDPMNIEEYAKRCTGMRDGPIRLDLQAMMADGATPEGLSSIFPAQQ